MANVKNFTLSFHFFVIEKMQTAEQQLKIVISFFIVLFLIIAKVLKFFSEYLDYNQFHKKIRRKTLRILMYIMLSRLRSRNFSFE
jgi:uncharacterized membrane protein YidH (DUF202 family)